MTTGAETRWLAVRALFEGAPATPERLALACGRSLRVVKGRIEAEQWRAAHRSRKRERADKVEAAIDVLIAAVEPTGGADGLAHLDKQRIDAVLAMARTLEKLGGMTGADEPAEENQARSDADMAAILRRIDDRIVELAEEYARRVVGEGGRA
jgi:hypothetical protein